MPRVKTWDHLVESFEIEMRPFRQNRLVKFSVEITHRSDTVIRFKLTGGAKILEMEKRLQESNQKAWKILAVNFPIESTEPAVRNLFEIRKLIDEKITGRSRHTYRSPAERSSG